MDHDTELCRHPLCGNLLPQPSQRWHDLFNYDYCSEACASTRWETSPRPASHATPSPQLVRFLRLCLDGQHAGCRPLARDSRKLAVAICHYISLLDNAAVEGCIEFLRTANADRTAAKMAIAYTGP